MKLWEKIFICTLIVFEAFFIPASIYLINNSFKSSIQEEIDSGISEEDRFCSSLRSNIVFYKIKKQELNNNYNITEEEIKLMAIEYLNSFRNNKIYLQLFDEKGNTVFGNFEVKVNQNRPELIISATDKVKYIIRDINGKENLFIASNLNLENNNYKFVYIKDISSIYANREKMLSVLLKLNLFVVVMLIIVLIILSKFIVKPINKLIKSTKKIADGNFGERVHVAADDEIGMLSKQFNNMADVIEDKISELKRISDDKQRFIDDLTHELRTPLTSIIGYADFLRTSKYDERTLLTSLTYIYDEGKRLESLSEKLMLLINIRKEKFIMKNESTEDLLQKINRAMIVKLKNKNIKLKITSENFVILMDAGLMVILITNLIDNAIKASKNGDEIILNVYKDKKLNVVFEVIDYGVGIPKEQIKKVLEPFYMVDKSRERANNGAGIGLALCREIAQIHNGKIDIISMLGKGTTVMVKINTGN